MIKTKCQMAIISTFTSETPRKEDVHKTRYSVTLSLSVDQHKALVHRLTNLVSHMIGAGFEAAQQLIEKEAARSPSTHTGLISLDCWGDDQSFSGMLLNGQIYPYEDKEPPRNLVLVDVDVSLTCRVMTKKDKTIVLAWTSHMIDQSGIKPQETDAKTSKKRS